MREFIGGALICIGMFTIPIAILGLISPARLGQSGKPAPSRLNITLILFMVFIVCMIIGGLIYPNSDQPPSSNTTTLTADDQLIKKTEKAMVRIENPVFQYHNRVLDMLEKVVDESILLVNEKRESERRKEDKQSN